MRHVFTRDHIGLRLGIATKRPDTAAIPPDLQHRRNYRLSVFNALYLARQLGAERRFLNNPTPANASHLALTRQTCERQIVHVYTSL